MGDHFRPPQRTDRPTLPYRPIYATPEPTLISGTSSPCTTFFSSPPGFPSQRTDPNATPTRSFHMPYSRVELRSFNVFVTRVKEDTSSESGSTGEESDHPQQSPKPGAHAEAHHRAPTRAHTPPTSPTPSHAHANTNLNRHSGTPITSPTTSSASSESAEPDAPQYLYAIRGKDRGRGRSPGGGLTRPNLSGLGAGRRKGRGMGRSPIDGRTSRGGRQRASSEMETVEDSSEGGEEESEGSAGWKPKKGTRKKGTPRASQKNQGARTGKRRIKGPDGSSCDHCRRHKRHCDFKRPQCGTCASSGKDVCSYTGLGLRRPIPSRANPPTPTMSPRADPPTSTVHVTEPVQAREAPVRKAGKEAESERRGKALFTVEELGEEFSGDDAPTAKEGEQNAIGKETGNEADDEIGEEADDETGDDEDAEGGADDGGYEPVGETETGGLAVESKAAPRRFLRAAAETATRRIARDLRKASISSSARSLSRGPSPARTPSPGTPLPIPHTKPPTPTTTPRYPPPQDIHHYLSGLSLPLPPLGPLIPTRFANLHDICPLPANRWSSISYRFQLRPLSPSARLPTPPTLPPAQTDAQTPSLVAPAVWANNTAALPPQELVERALAQQAEASERAKKLAMRVGWARGDGPMWGGGVGRLEVDWV